MVIALDCTAIAIVTIHKPLWLPTYDGHPVLRTLLSKVGTTAAEVVVRLLRLREFIKMLNESPIERTMICVPLDVMRPDATTHRWQPLMLSEQKKTGNFGRAVGCVRHALYTPKAHREHNDHSI